MRRFIPALLVLCFCGSFSFAASPALSIIQPRGAQRGTEAVLNFQGGRLVDTQEVLIYSPGITVKKLEVVNDASVKVTVTISPDCRLGEHSFRLRTATGVSDLRTFWIGAFPCVDEIEPNSEFDKPQPIALNTTVHGSIGGEDVDYFVVECKKGQRLSVEVEAQRLGTGFWDPYVAILDAKRFELVYNDDSPLIGQDGRCSVIVPNDGKYIVQIRESSFGGGAQYRLHIGTFALPTGVIPAGGKPGEELEVTFVGDPSGPIKQKVKLPAAPDENFRLHCQTPDGISPTGFKFRIANLTNVVETPSAAAPAGAPSGGPAPVAFNGTISKPDETKYFKFAAKKGQVFDIHCYARRLGSPLDPVMHVSDTAPNNALGTYRAGADDAIGPDSYFRFAVPEDKEYFIWVHDHLRKGGPDYFFRVEVTPVEAKTSTGIPKVDGNNVSNQDRQTIVVAKGNRYATLLVANRTDWGGPATIGFDKLPPGLGLVTDPVDPGLNIVPVVFEAKADAPTGGLLAELQAKPADAKVIASTRTDLDVNFNLALNNTPFHRVMTDRIAVVVTDACPYSIEVIEPKAPVVQNGSMNLRVVAKRLNGFKGAITVFPLFTPPGMGIQGSAVIPEGATETVLNMNAAPNAAPRKWKTAVTGVSDYGKGPVWVSSQLFTLEVAPPFVTFAQERTAVEQGAKTTLFGKLTVATPFEGKAKATILGLPAKVTAPTMEFAKDQKELTFEVATDKTSPAGKHGVFCMVVITHNGESIVHNIGGNELRIDVPLPPKVAATPTPAAPTPPPAAAPAKPPEKRLTRLEQLRLEQEEREKAVKKEKEAPPAPKKEEPKKN